MDEDGQTPLHHAAWGGHADVVGVLVDKGADVIAVKKLCDTPLHVADRKSVV